MRRFGPMLAVLALIPLAAGVIPAGAAVPGGTPVVHLQPENLPSCKSASSPWYLECADFGKSVATDGSLVVVGARSQPLTVGNTHYFGVGAAYVYSEDAAGWSGQELRASDWETWDRFGHAVAAAEGRFVVSAFSAGGGGEGQAYLFEPDGGGGWDETILDPVDGGGAGLGAHVGQSVAFDGNRIVVGESGVIVDQGAVHVFERRPAGWLRTHRLTSGEVTNEGFGYSVAVDGDRIVVGAPYYGEVMPPAPSPGGHGEGPDTTLEYSGRVFVFTWDGSSWDREILLPPTDEWWQLYGWSVAVDGDTVFVGARNRDKVPGSDDDGGAVFAYTWNGTRWKAEEIAPDPHPDGLTFGSSVAAADGMLVVGGVGAYGDGTNAQGSSYLFSKGRRAWVGEALPEADTANGSGDKLGYAVAVTGDVVVAGAPETKSVSSYLTILYGHGSAYVYRACGGRAATIVGTPGDDTLTGTLDSDVIAALAGDDAVNASRGHDLVCAGPGRDRVKAGAGKDTVYGDAGNDLLYGNAHDDLLFGGDGIDALFGMAGNDALDGGEGRDVATFPTAPGPVTGSLATGTATGDGSDTLTGLEVLVGGRFNDHLTGDAGGNRLVGRDGNDILLGGDGKDLLSGGRGDDTLDGQGGDDSLYGGPGTDTCSGESQDGCES